MIRIATRRSPLARWQAEWVAKSLQAKGHDVQLVLLTSEGDTNTGVIDGSQAVGLFTKRIQQAVLDDEADLAVHSLKDLPTQIDTGLELVAVPPRAAVHDCLVTADGRPFEQLSAGARIGTGSRRRGAQLRHQRPDLQVEPIRGNVRTRLEKIDTEGFQAVVLAQAGLQRLELDQYTSQPLPLDWMLPAAGQGALGLEVRRGDQATAHAVAQLDDPNSHAAVTAERAVLRHLQAGCLAPVATYAEVSPSQLKLTAVVLAVDGSQRLAAVQSVDWSTHDLRAADTLGIEVAEQLLTAGAAPLITAAR